MSLKIFASFLVISLMCNAILSEEAKEKSRESDIRINSWFVAFDEAAFSDNAGIKMPNIPAGSDSYRIVLTILSPRFTVGYHVTPKWSFEAQLQLGPKESYEFFKGGDLLGPSMSIERRFMSVSTARTLSLGRGYELEAKVGVVNALFESRIKYPDSQLDHSLTEIKPMISIGLRQRITPRFTLGMDFSRYFLSKPGSITSGTLGLRYYFD